MLYDGAFDGSNTKTRTAIPGQTGNQAIQEETTERKDEKKKVNFLLPHR